MARGWAISASVTAAKWRSKIASEYHGFRAMVASEPASHEFLRLKPDATAHVDPKTGLLNVEKMLMREPAKVRPRITEDVARERVATIETPIFVQGRDADELQGIFRVSYDLLHEAGKEAKWASYDHALHGFVYPVRNADGSYTPDAHPAASGRRYARILRQIPEVVRGGVRSLARRAGRTGLRTGGSCRPPLLYQLLKQLRL